MAFLDDELISEATARMAAPPPSPDQSGGYSPVVESAPQDDVHKPGGLKAYLSNALKAYGDNVISTLSGRPNAYYRDIGQQKRNLEQNQFNLDSDYKSNLIEQSQPVTIPDNVATLVGLEKGSQVPKSSYGQVMSAYMRMIGQQNKPSAASDKERYMGLQTKLNLGVPLSQEDQAWAKAFEQTQTLNAVKGAEARGQAFGNIRVKTLYDTKTKQMRSMNANEWNAVNQSEPGRYIEPGNSIDWVSQTSKVRGLNRLATTAIQVPDGKGGTFTTTAMDAIQNRLPGVGTLNFERILNKQVQMDDVVGAFNAVKQYTHVLNRGNNAAISAALADPEHTLTQYAQSGVIGNLDNDERDYVVNLLMAREAAGSMRQILGQGQSSDMQRRLIMSTLPGANTPDKNYADKQLDAALGILKRVAPSVPKGVVNRGESKGVIDQATAHDYFIKAGKNAAKARSMALADGWKVK